MDSRDRRLTAAGRRALAGCARPFYAATVRARNIGYDRGLLRTQRVERPVLSIGNLTTGGVGKTPLVIHTVDLLRRRGRRPGVILRGYKGGGQGGSDEARLLAQMLSGTPVVADPDRLTAARRLIAEEGVDAIVLDDGFQHRRIARELDIVLIDATRPFGFGHVLPRGLMREPPEALRRADAVLVTRADQIDPASLASLDARIARLHGRAPLGHIAHRWGEVLDSHDRPAPLMEETRVFTFCGVGNPAAFREQAAQGAVVVGHLPFGDHHSYTPEDLRRIFQDARRAGADVLLTTEKDWVKLKPLIESWSDQPSELPILRPRLTLAFLDGGEAYERQVVAKAGGKSVDGAAEVC